MSMWVWRRGSAAVGYSRWCSYMFLVFMGCSIIWLTNNWLGVKPTTFSTTDTDDCKDDDA
jgi:hypothetical protein